MLFNVALGLHYPFLPAAKHLSTLLSANLCMTLSKLYKPLNQLNYDCNHDSQSAANDSPQCKLGKKQFFLFG
jgi:hypothetical protein